MSRVQPGAAALTVRDVRRDLLGGESMSVLQLQSRPRSRRVQHLSATQRQLSATPAAFAVPRYLAALAARMHNLWRHGAAIATLGAMSDSQLRDIGVNWTEIRHFVRERHH